MNEHAFTLMPMSKTIDLDPGETYTGTITISNPVDATSDFSYKVTIDPYSVVGEEYNADLLTQHNRSMMTKWITIEEPTGTIAPNESKEVKYTITVPENAPAGGQYAALAVAANNENTAGDGLAVQNVVEMASIVYAKVAGETVHGGGILENNIPGFVTNIPAMLTSRIENTGNVHEYADYTITVTDAFTGRVILPTEDSDGHYSEIIMPETTYASEREINNLPIIGVVKVSQTIKYNGETSVQEGNIVICPIWFMVLVAVTIAALITTIVMMVKKHRKKKASHEAV